MTGEVQSTLSGWRVNLPKPICLAMREAGYLSQLLIPTYGSQSLHLVPLSKLDDYRKVMHEDWGYSERLINQLIPNKSDGIRIESGKKKRFSLPSAAAQRQKIERDSVISLIWKGSHLEVWSPTRLDAYIKSLLKSA